MAFAEKSENFLKAQFLSPLGAFPFLSVRFQAYDALLG